jgi:acyl-CoA synthetase (AMP-forming)/AMP-acid ligase II
VQLSRVAERLAAGLQRLDCGPGERVALILPDERDFVTAFFGTTVAGAAVVPLAPPQSLRRLGRFLSHAESLLAAARVRVIITSSALRSTLGTMRGGTAGVSRITTVQELTADGTAFEPVPVALDDPALVQFTSGSTSLPKGVVLSHRNLAANCAVIDNEGLQSRAGDRAVSWLPLFHDMGLIGFVIAPLYGGVPTSLMSPLRFLRHPVSWLRALSSSKGTITYAPNFAYAYCARRVRDDQLQGVDLSRVRVFGCGAEPIHAETLREFARRFARWGAREESFYPSYGMAESSLAISFGRGIPVDRVSRSALADEGLATPARVDERDVVELVGCGSGFSGHELAIVDPETERPLPERRVGEIRIKGPSVTSGYFDAPESNSSLFDVDGRLRTGDLGYLAGGQVFLCGRMKDLIIVRGRNYYPQDIEWAAAGVDGVRRGCVIAFSRRKAAGVDELVVIAETKPGAAAERLDEAIRSAVREAIGLRVDSVKLVPPGSVPKTSSGKLKRAEAARMLADGELGPARDESAVATAGRLLESQWAHLRHRIFGHGG